MLTQIRGSGPTRAMLVIAPVGNASHFAGALKLCALQGRYNRSKLRPATPPWPDLKAGLASAPSAGLVRTAPGPADGRLHEAFARVATCRLRIVAKVVMAPENAACQPYGKPNKGPFPTPCRPSAVAFMVVVHARRHPADRRVGWMGFEYLGELAVIKAPG